MKNMHNENESVSLYQNYKIDSEIKNTEEKYYFIFDERKLLLLNNQIPLIKDLEELGILNENIKNNLYLGEFYLKDSYVVELENWENKGDFDFVELYELFDINEEIYYLAGRAIQVLDWENTHQYCGRCGSKTYTSDIERAKVCPECGFISFTRICPAIITTIIKQELDENGNIENKLLMAKHSYHKHNRYSLIAGFLEAGETIEEAVQREIKEEVGIEVEDIEYFGSQSWPFPNSLMIGCICKYKSGEINVDGNEIVKAKWMSKEEIELPESNISIFSKLLKNFIENF